MTHTTDSACCAEFIVIQVGWCARRSVYRVRGQWCPDQLQFFDDAVHDVEIVVDDLAGVRPAIGRVYREFSTLLRLSELRNS